MADVQGSRREFLIRSGAAAVLAAAATNAHADFPEDAREPIAADPRRHPLMTTSHPGIASARDAALALLKPSQSELEKGLRIHAESVVFDTYGFAPRAAVDADRAIALTEAAASDRELADLREESTMTRPALDEAEREEFREAFRCAGVTCIFQNAGEESQDPLILIRRLARFTWLTDMLPDTLSRASLPTDIEIAKSRGRHCLYLTGNGVPLTQQWVTAEEELACIRLFFQLGIRMMHLTYNRRNMLGDGCGETTDGGVSDLGRQAIAEMNRVGVIVDVAHSGWRTSREAALASTRPMVASHTVCDAVNHHIRAKPDDVIRAIGDTGGLIGICCIPNFLGGGGDLAALLDHLDYAIRTFGSEHVGIGTDISHTSQFAAEANRRVPRRGPSRPRFAALWPDGALGGHWPGRKTIAWTNWPLFTVGMVQRGHSEEDIRKVLGQNMLRVCRDVLPERLKELDTRRGDA